MTMHGSYSSISLHRSCPQKWFYAKVLRLEKIEEESVPARDFGTWWHALMAADSLERGREHGSLFKIPDTIEATDGVRFVSESVTVEDVFRQADRLWNRMSDDVQNQWSSYLGEDFPQRLRGAYARWTSRWAEDRKHEKPLAVELGWERQLPSSDGVLVGYVDEVYLDSRRNVIVVRDHKTLKALKTQTTQDDLMDSQLHLYAWGAAPIIEEWGMGSVRATAYDRVKAVASPKPRLTKSGSLSKTVTQFDVDTYLEWVAEGQTFEGLKKDGSASGVYEADPNLVESLSSPAHRSLFHQRTLSPINTNIIRSHLRAAVDSMAEIGVTRERGIERGEVARNPGEACRWCDFADLCRAQLVGGPQGEYDLQAMGLRPSTDSGRFKKLPQETITKETE